VVVLSGCGQAERLASDGSEAEIPDTDAGPRTTGVGSPSTTSVPPRPTGLPPTAPPTTGTVAAPAFEALIGLVTEEELGGSWRPDCPVPVEDLRRIDVTYRDDDGNVADGVVIVHADQAERVVTVFARLFEAEFPIRSLRPISAFDGDDDASMAANNTSGFNCREIDGWPGVWSQHAFGRAIDINPLVNPWVRGDLVDPPAGRPYIDRTVEAPGLIRPGDAVTAAFAEVGWIWGGDWTSTVDYQHFSHNGR
jgi:D-alanyl-D-alanine carboxypeptidase